MHHIGGTVAAHTTSAILDVHITTVHLECLVSRPVEALVDPACLSITKMGRHPEDTRASVKDDLEVLRRRPHTDLAKVLDQVGILEGGFGDKALLAGLLGMVHVVHRMLLAFVGVVNPLEDCFCVSLRARVVMQRDHDGVLAIWLRDLRGTREVHVVVFQAWTVSNHLRWSFFGKFLFNNSVDILLDNNVALIK
jgi:hypothetical protein